MERGHPARWNAGVPPAGTPASCPLCRGQPFAMRIVVPKAPWSAVSVSRRTATALLLSSGRRQLRSASLPHSKALRAFSCTVVSRRIMKFALRAGSACTLIDLAFSFGPPFCHEVETSLARERDAPTTAGETPALPGDH